MAPSHPTTLLVASARPDLRHRLADAGAELSWVSSAEAAVERAMEDSPDIVMLDHALAGIGAAAAADILRRAGYAGGLIAFVDDDCAMSDPALFDEVLRPPIEAPALQRSIARIVQARDDPFLDTAASTLDLGDFERDFRAGLPAALASLQAAVSTADIPALRRQAHSLRGSAAAFGWPEITRECAAIEEQIDRGDHGGALERATTMIAAAEATLNQGGHE